MLSILVYDTKPDEAGLLQEEIRYLTARCSDEQTKFYVLPEARKASSQPLRKPEIKSQGAASGSGKVDLEKRLEETLEEISFLHLALVDVTTLFGIDAAKKIRAAFPDVQILVMASMQVSPVRYLTPAIRPTSLLLRPCEEAQRKQTVEDFFTTAVRPLLHEESDAQVFWAKTRDGTQRIPYSAILYFEAREKKVFVRTRSLEYGMGGTIEKILEKLPSNFIRCHRSYIVNKDYIERIRLSEGFVYLAESIMLPISRSYKAELKEWSLAGES